MLDDLAGKRTGERIQILRERKGLSRPVLAARVSAAIGWDVEMAGAAAFYE